MNNRLYLKCRALGLNAYRFRLTLTVMLFVTMMMVDVFFGLNQFISIWKIFFILTNLNSFLESTKTLIVKEANNRNSSILVDTSPNAQDFIMNDNIGKSKKNRSTVKENRDRATCFST